MNENLQVEEKVKTIISSRLKDKEKVRNLTYETPLLSLGIDSILALSILVEIEEEFNIEISDGDLNMDRIKNISSFAGLVRSYLLNSGIQN
jgi:acyl carrier protein